MLFVICIFTVRHVHIHIFWSSCSTNWSCCKNDLCDRLAEAASRLHAGPFFSSVSLREHLWHQFSSDSLLFGSICSAVCVFNHCRHPPTFPQLNFLAPKLTLTRKPMKTQTGLSISLPRSWTPPVLRSSGLLEQVSQSAISKLLLFGWQTAWQQASS